MNFEQAVEIILHHEGGYVNDPNDPGGETKWGISKASFPHLDIASLTKSEASQIYRQKYWDRCKCDELPKSLRLIVFDCAVNQGAHYAITLLQEAAGSPADGIIGPNTLSRIGSCNEFELLTKFVQKRKDRYFKNPNFDRYGKGWIGRLLDISLRSVA